MIPATLIYNSKAGSSQSSSPEALTSALAEAGFAAHYLPTKQAADLDVLEQVSGIIFVAGGDGTVREVAKRLVGRSDTVLAVLPLGTSNNIAHTLELNGSAEDVARSYAQHSVCPFDVGKVQAPWGHDLFFEACGCGIFADVLAAYDPGEKKSPLRAAQAILTTLPTFQPEELSLTLDGQRKPETPLLLLEVMNIRAVGNSMKLASSADPSDGWLNVIRVDAEQRDSVLAYAAALAGDDFETLPSVQADTAQTIGISYLGQAFHVDGEVRDEQPGVRGTVQIEVWPGALRVLVPRTL